MVKITIGAEWAWLNTQAIKSGVGNIPFCYSKTWSLLKYDEAPDSFPDNGIAKLRLDCLDLEDIITKDEDRKAWAEFFKLAEKKGIGARDSFAKQLQSDKTCAHAVKLLNKWFDKIRRRSEMMRKVDEVLKEARLQVWQVYASKRMQWPLPKKVSTCLLHLPCYLSLTFG